MYFMASCFWGGVIIAIFDNFYGCMNMAELELAQRLKILREKRKLTQTRLANLMGVSPRVYNRWENGDSTPYWDSIVKIANLLDVSLDEMAGRSNPSDTTVIRNPKLHELYKKIDVLTDEEQQALIVLIDSVIARSKMNKIMQDSQGIRD